MKPYLIDSPTCVSLSGGRTSAYMLRQVLDANPPSVIDEHLTVCFANTGKEDEATLRFVQRIGQEWCVPIVWLEFVSRHGDERVRVVSFETASRNGEPFDRLIDDKKFLPNAVMRFCTEELKIKPIRAFTGLAEEDTIVGVRADEPHRIGKMRTRGLRIPLVDVGVTVAHVREFWKAQPFDLELEERNGVTPWGNCDFCFLKGLPQIMSMAAHSPQRVVWWGRAEKRAKGTFAKDRPSYTAIAEFARDQSDLFAGGGIDCFCGD